MLYKYPLLNIADYNVRMGAHTAHCRSPDSRNSDVAKLSFYKFRGTDVNSQIFVDGKDKKEYKNSMICSIAITHCRYSDLPHLDGVWWVVVDSARGQGQGASQHQAHAIMLYHY